MTPFPREAYRALTPYAPDRRPIEVDLSDNTSRWGVHPAALRTVREASPEALLRYPPVYADALRAAIARRYGVPEEAVATGCGSDDLLDSAFRAAGEPGGEVRFVPPTFSMIEAFARMNGLEPLPLARELPTPGAPFGALPDPADLLEGDPAVVYLCRPNNPTGEVQPRAWLEALADAAEARGPRAPVILLDEAYAEFLPPEEAAACEAFIRRAATRRRVVVLRTMSKAYGLAGLRVGYAIGAPEVVREIEKSRGPYKVSRPAEAAACAALDDAEAWLRGILDAVREERARLTSELAKRGLAPLPSGANFLCVPLTADAVQTSDVAPTADVPRTTDAAPTAGAAQTTEAPLPPAPALTAALRERGVAVRPFPALPGIGDAIRVTIGPRHETDRFLHALDELLR